MSDKITYLDEIVFALTQLDGSASLNEINNYIEKRNLLPSIKTNTNWKRNISAVIQRHCLQTKSYKGGENIFYSVYGIGEGYWGLLSMKECICASDITPVEKRIVNKIKNENIDNTEKEMIIKARIGQGIFRKELIDKYHHCIITGIKDTRLLVASHIKPWRTANNNDRISPENGLLLSPLYDKLFDIGLITFDNNMKIVLSDSLSLQDKLKIDCDQTIKYIKNPSMQLQRNMEYHRDVIFKSNEFTYTI